MNNLPKVYLDNMQALLGDEFNQYLQCFENTRIHGLKVNTSKISVEEFLKICPFKLERVPWTKDGFYFDENDRLSKHPYYYAGLYYLQEPSAMLPAEVLEIEENDLVLDACAAPGGKSLKLANKLNNTGVLISNDISVSRAQILLKTLENAGIKNTYIMAEDLNNLKDMNGLFDKILLDAPCSGEGMFRKDSNLIKSWNVDSNNYYSSIQKDLIIKALDLLKPGGKLVYSTCTFSKLEDEDVVEYAFKHYPGIKILPINNANYFEKGLTENTRNCVRLYPHKIKGEGHFVAYIQKDGKKTNSIIKNTPIKLPHYDFFNNIHLDGNSILSERKDKFYLIPDLFFDTKNLRILRSGLYLGEVKHDKFEPSQSLAFALKEREFEKTINLDINDPRVIKYLKCETLDVKDFDIEGYVLVLANHYPLGFGVIKNGVLKNKLAANYRYQ